FSLILAMRGAEFQAFSRRGRFTTSANVAAANQFADNGLNNQCDWFGHYPDIA
ncbi:hypothetical protein ITE14_06645, partial [Acinetobacter baumannii]|nr:hypothetical protein [Acinetobacter baumannii]